METTTTIETAPDSPAPTALATFSPINSEIATLAAEYMPLTIAGVNDKEGYALVHRARMIVKGHRVNIDKHRKQLNADALAWQRKVNDWAKEKTALLEPIENHLTAEEDRIDKEKEAIKNAARIKAEAEEKARREAEEARLAAEREAEAAKLREERAKIDAERKALENQQRAQRAEQDRLENQRRAQEREQQRLSDIEAARLKKIEDEKRAASHRAEVEKAKADAAERSRIETEARLTREANEAKEREHRAKEAAEAARAKAEQMKPDREKLLIVASCVAGITVPEVAINSMESGRAVREIQGVLDDAAAKILLIVNRYLPEMDPELAAMIG